MKFRAKITRLSELQRAFATLARDFTSDGVRPGSMAKPVLHYFKQSVFNWKVKTDQ